MNQPSKPMQDLAAQMQQASQRARALSPTAEEVANNLAAASRIMNERLLTIEQASANLAKVASAFR